jgi:hypothetical protein
VKVGCKVLRCQAKDYNPDGIRTLSSDLMLAVRHLTFLTANEVSGGNGSRPFAPPSL